jgi:uncharacterized protein (DUF1697 family)
MTTYAGLVRGINVGKARRLAMADLRELVKAEGFTDPRTLLNSGNVVFSGATHPFPTLAARLETAIETRVGFRPHVVVVDAAWMDVVLQENPLTQADNPSRLLVGFVQDTHRLESVRELASRDWGSEALAVGSRAVYLWMPDGILESRVLHELGTRIGPWLTTRNWSTVQKLQVLMR